ncbi:MAG: ATP-binding protein [Pyrinomonadaceae bacterium]
MPQQCEVVRNCELCLGTGMEVVPGKGARRCCCRAESLQSNFAVSAQIPLRFAECTLQNYTPAQSNGSQLRALNLAYRLVKDYPAVERGLLFAGPVGVGKTHLSVAILRGLNEKGVCGLFYECGALLKAMQDSYGAASQISEANILAPVYDAEVLVLDELGATRPTDWARDAVMQIIGSRYNRKKLTVLTTNFFDTRRASDEEILSDRVGVRVRSRLREMCLTIVMDGSD